MVSICGRYVFTYNSEIYNHQDLRTDLKDEGGGSDWHWHSDTETMLAVMRHWGVSWVLELIIGMFAIALCDGRAGTPTLARDPMGKELLY